MLTPAIVEKVVTRGTTSLPGVRYHLSAIKERMDQTFATKIRRHNPWIVWVQHCPKHH